MYIASNGLKTIVILQDNDPLHPRRDQDNVTNMICWHSRYDLGDKHDYKNPHEFAVAMADRYLFKRDIFLAMKNGEFSGFRLHENEQDHTYTVEADVSLNPRIQKWEVMDWKVSKELGVIEGEDTSFDFEADVLDQCYAAELLAACEKYGNVAILPLHLYDHSGISMSTGSFVGRAQHAQWDSGQVGYIYMDMDAAMKDLRMPAETLRIAKMLPDELRSPVKFRKEPDRSAQEVVKGNGFVPVTDPAKIKNLYDAERDQPLIDENLLSKGLIFKKNHKLYVLDSPPNFNTINMVPIATFNPDLQRLTSENWKERALEVMKLDVTIYDNYLTGEVYGYKTYEGLNEEESCWGYIPGEESIQDLMAEELGWWFGSKPEFDYEPGDDFDIDDYFVVNDFPELYGDITKKVLTLLYEDFQTKDPFPYGMSFEDIRADKFYSLTTIVGKLYDAHEDPTVEKMREAIFSVAGVSRALQPKLSAADLEPGKDYTKDELMDILKKKPSLDDMIKSASRKSGPGADDMPRNISDPER